MGTLSLEKEYANILVDAKRKLFELVDSEKAKGMAIKELVRAGEPTEDIFKTIWGKN